MQIVNIRLPMSIAEKLTKIDDNLVELENINMEMVEALGEGNRTKHARLLAEFNTL